jgi:hypothetical protein
MPKRVGAFPIRVKEIRERLKSLNCTRAQVRCHIERMLAAKSKPKTAIVKWRPWVPESVPNMIIHCPEGSSTEI